MNSVGCRQEMPVEAMNFNGVEVCVAPTFKRSLSHQIKKLMCYNRHLNKDKIVRPTSSVDLDSLRPQGTNSHPSARVNCTTVQTEAFLRIRYEERQLSLQNKLSRRVDQNMPKQKFGDIVMGMMTMPELPPFGSADIQQVVGLSDARPERRPECERSQQNRCKGYCSNEGTNGSSSYPQEANFRRSFPLPSGADKPAFLDFPPSSPSCNRQRNYLNEEMYPHSQSLTDEFPLSSLFPFEKSKPRSHRNSAFQIYQRDEPTKDNNRHRSMLDESSSSGYGFDFPVPSGAEKVAFLDCPPALSEDSLISERMKGPSCHHSSHADLQQPMFLSDVFAENLSKSHCGLQEHIPQVVHTNQPVKPGIQNCQHASQGSFKRKSCDRAPINDTLSSSGCHNHRKHLNSCSRKNATNIPNLMDLSVKQDNSISDFQLRDPFCIDSPSIQSPASTINSADISFDLTQGSEFQQDKPSTSVPQRRGPGRPRKPENERKRKPTKSIPLWKFLLNMLHDPATCPELVRWEDTSKGMFRIVRSDQVAARWGMRKDNTKMNYEKFSRAMRYYYKQHIFEAVPGKRLVYQFGRAAKEWRPKNMENPNFDHRHQHD